MIAVDTSSLSAFLAGEEGRDVDAVDEALADTRLLLPPVVLTEVLSSPALSTAQAAALLAIPTVAIELGFWERAGKLRRSVLARGHKARLANTLIAQCCIDAGVALITRDRDFRNYVGAGLHVV